VNCRNRAKNAEKHRNERAEIRYKLKRLQILESQYGQKTLYQENFI
jgi:hypothetical protein